MLGREKKKDKRTVSQEDLSLALGGGRIRITIRFLDFIRGLDVDEGAFPEAHEVFCIAFSEGHDSVPRCGGLGAF